MIATVHIADVGPARALRILARPPKPSRIAGLRHADVGTAGPLRQSAVPSPQLGRVAMLGFWDNDAALDGFADPLLGGWRARLEPVRLWGSWPGVPDDLPRSRATSGDGPVVVLTLARTRLSQLRRFLRTSLDAERRALAAPGMVWGAALTKPPFVATCSIWESAEAAAEYAYGRNESAHPGAIAADRAKPFHHQQAFVRFRVLSSEGGLDGKNALPERWMEAYSRG